MRSATCTSPLCFTIRCRLSQNFFEGFWAFILWSDFHFFGGSSYKFVVDWLVLTEKKTIITWSFCWFLLCFWRSSVQKKKTKRTKKEGNVVLSRGVLLKPNLGRERLVIPLSRSQHFLTPGRYKLKPSAVSHCLWSAMLFVKCYLF